MIRGVGEAVYCAINNRNKTPPADQNGTHHPPRRLVSLVQYKYSTVAGGDEEKPPLRHKEMEHDA
jgi:hypothetical protein